MGGDVESANAIWLLNWRAQLENARRTGGAVLQIVVEPGLSKMQLAEESMAADKGVRVIRIDCTKIRNVEYLDAREASELAVVQALRQEAAQVKSGALKLTVPSSRGDMEQAIVALQDEVARLRTQTISNNAVTVS